MSGNLGSFSGFYGLVLKIFLQIPEKQYITTLMYYGKNLEAVCFHK